jgi:hypothetical protein
MGAEEVTIRLRGEIDLSALKSCFIGMGTSLSAIDQSFEPRLVVRPNSGAFVFVAVERGVGVDCQYAVCHPVVCDKLFVMFVDMIGRTFELRFELLEEVARSLFCPGDPDFIKTSLCAISEKRRSWCSDFGVWEAVLTPSEAIERGVNALLSKDKESLA